MRAADPHRARLDRALRRRRSPRRSPSCLRRRHDRRRGRGARRQTASRPSRAAAGSVGGPHRPLVFYAFDLLHLDGEDLRDEPLLERKERLEKLLGERATTPPLRYSEHFVEPGKIMLRHACRMGLEGVISKRADAPYRSGRGNATGSSRNARSARNSSSPAMCRRRRPGAACARCSSAITRTASCSMPAASAPASRPRSAAAI